MRMLRGGGGILVQAIFENEQTHLTRKFWLLPYDLIIGDPQHMWMADGDSRVCYIVRILGCWGRMPRNSNHILNGDIDLLRMINLESWIHSSSLGLMALCMAMDHGHG